MLAPVIADCLNVQIKHLFRNSFTESHLDLKETT